MPTPRVSKRGKKAKDHKFLVVLLLLLLLTLPKVMLTILQGPLQTEVPFMAAEIDFLL